MISSEIFFKLESLGFFRGKFQLTKITSLLPELSNGIIKKIIGIYEIEFQEHIPVTFFKNTKRCEELSNFLRGDYSDSADIITQPDLFH